MERYSETEKKYFDGLPDGDFVLDQRHALKYLRYCADMVVECGFKDEQDSECVGGIVEDIIDLALRITKENLDFVKFVECPMSASGLNIVPMVEKGE